jgi:transposase
MELEEKELERPIRAWIGIDWADEKHDVSLYEVATGKQEALVIRQTPEALEEWLGQLRSRYEGGYVAVVLEQGRGGLLNALMGSEFLVLYIINPKSLSSFREAFYGSGATSDPVDAELMREMVQQNPKRFRAWRPDDDATRSLRLLTEARRKLVDQSTALTNQLTAVLKGCYPQALAWVGSLDTAWACDFLERWPTLQMLQGASRRRILSFLEKHPRAAALDLVRQLQEIQRARPLTKDAAVLQASALTVQALVAQLRPVLASITEFDRNIAAIFRKHPDRPIFESFPGAGAALAPRLIAAFGTDRDRFQAATEIQELAGIAPVTEKSGKKSFVHWRYACSKFVRQTFQEFADHSRRWCEWAKAHYELLRRRGKSHNAAVRALAYKWIRILFRCWKDRRPYQDEVYTNSLLKHGSPLASLLAGSVENP